VIDRHSTTPAPLRQHQALRDLPIIAVYQPTPEYDEAATIRDLENGVDAVICTQNTRQLVAHVRAILRRQACQVSVAREYAIEGLHMNLDTHEVRVNGTPVELTPKEFRILRYFLEAPGRVLSREEMLNRVWGEGHAIEEHALDLHIHRLRLKIEADPSCPKYLVTVRGIGFKLRVEW